MSPVARATAAPAPAPAPAGQQFAAVLEAQRPAPESLPTVTLGQMIGLTASAPPATDAIPMAAAAPVAAAAPLGVAAPVGAAAPVAGAPTAAGAMAWPVQGRITSEFGPRVHPITGTHRQHDGIDIAAPTGTPIAASASGRVTFAGARGGYGNVVIIDHGNGTETRYAHQDTIAVSVGQTVRAGERVGTVGSTGMSTGPHLHFEVRRNGQSVNPRRVLP